MSGCPPLPDRRDGVWSVEEASFCVRRPPLWGVDGWVWGQTPPPWGSGPQDREWVSGRSTEIFWGICPQKAPFCPPPPGSHTGRGWWGPPPLPPGAEREAWVSYARHESMPGSQRGVPAEPRASDCLAGPQLRVACVVFFPFWNALIILGSGPRIRWVHLKWPQLTHLYRITFVNIFLAKNLLHSQMTKLCKFWLKTWSFSESNLLFNQN